MRLKLFCNHEYVAVRTNRGENLLGDVTYAVEFQCRRCLKVKREKGYRTRADARFALDQYRQRAGL